MKIAMTVPTLGTMVLLLPASLLSGDDGTTLENVVSPGPNRADEPEYIADLLRRVVRVSVETVEIVNALAGLRYAPE